MKSKIIGIICRACIVTNLTIALCLIVKIATAQTTFIKTTEKFKNGEYVYQVKNNGVVVGEFWPIHGMNLVTNQTDAIHFAPGADIDDIQSALRGIATAPDGMTTGSQGMYLMEGKALSNGRPCGDGTVRDYGIVVVDKGFSITFTHAREHNVDSLYAAVQKRNGTLFYLPSIFRNGKALSSTKTVDKVLVRRNTPGGVQMGVIVFNQLMTYDQARAIVTGLDIYDGNGNAISKTTHIYVLDGGPTWGQSCKEVNGTAQLVGTRNASVVTNYLVFY